MRLAKSRTVVVMALSPIGQDNRILRQIASIRSTGRAVVAIGYPCRSKMALQGGAADCAIGDLTFVDCEPVHWGLAQKVKAALGFLVARVLPGEKNALRLSEVYPGVISLVKASLIWVKDYQSAGGALEDLALVAQDWTALPAVLALHERYGIPFHYDTHEFAVEEHASSLLWRLIFPRLIKRIEAAGIARAAGMSCVSQGIRDAMAVLYSPDIEIACVRNVPDSMPLAPKPADGDIEVLYHGLFKADRGLLELVASVSSWPLNFRLTLRGFAPNARFGEALNAAVLHTGGRVKIVPLVAPEEIVSCAQLSDIGVFLPDVVSPQNRFAMPNKLFEYLHAGLMVIVPRGTDMAALVQATGSGLAVEGGAADMARIFSEITLEQINAFKIRSGAVAQELTWAREQQVFLSVLGMV